MTCLSISKDGAVQEVGTSLTSLISLKEISGEKAEMVPLLLVSSPYQLTLSRKPMDKIYIEESRSHDIIRDSGHASKFYLFAMWRYCRCLYLMVPHRLLIVVHINGIGWVPSLLRAWVYARRAWGEQDHNGTLSNKTLPSSPPWHAIILYYELPCYEYFIEIYSPFLNRIAAVLILNPCVSSLYLKWTERKY